jgi:cytochrome c oxidase subunit 3/cytochrome o ubiquinol oxidase subunit 3
MGVWAFLSSECVFFASLIATYLVYKGRDPAGHLPQEVLDIPFTGLLAFILLMSSLTMVLALAGAKGGDQRRLTVWLAATAGLGLCFLGGQAIEFTQLVLEHGITPDNSLFGATFFTTTGFHGTHVGIGVIWLLLVLARALRGGFTAYNFVGVELAGLYWHFVDLVWVAIFFLLYLIP